MSDRLNVQMHTSQDIENKERWQDKVLTFIDFSHLSYFPTKPINYEALIKANQDVKKVEEPAANANIKEFAVELIDEII